MREHKGLDLAGIIIIYICSGIVLLNALVNFSYLTSYNLFILLIYVTSGILTFLYHINIINNSILIGIFGIFTGLLIGGIFILIGNSKRKEISSPKENNSLEAKLNVILNLREKGILSKEEYEEKRKDIISKFE